MTQKDLLYLEDAYEHEKIIIKLCNDFLSKISDEELAIFIEEQINSHTKVQNTIMSFLKEEENG